MLKLCATYCNLLCCRLSPYSDGKKTAACHKNRAELYFCGMLRPLTYDYAGSVNTTVTAHQLTAMA